MKLMDSMTVSHIMKLMDSMTVSHTTKLLDSLTVSHATKFIDSLTVSHHETRGLILLQTLLYIHKDHKEYWGQGAQDGHLDFHTASKLCRRLTDCSCLYSLTLVTVGLAEFLAFTARVTALPDCQPSGTQKAPGCVPCRVSRDGREVTAATHTMMAVKSKAEKRRGDSMAEGLQATEKRIVAFAIIYSTHFIPTVLCSGCLTGFVSLF